MPPATLEIASSDSIDNYWDKVSLHEEHEKICFRTQCKLVKALIILQHSNAGVERAFSTLKLIKTAHRPSLQSPMLNAPTHIFIGQQQHREFEPTDTIKKKARHLRK
ncbi:hypothetical protein PR048_016636 [Dryococelus australis]|uniref:HAT C-terminal dimerisation domain-containing protein n=1 Tax=Dryococelus australis TaxID=614101 RepID=A0ABQ9H797_9NEOP|nr:hypothetical protein PR048_016636 [Dryococelus australis]